MMDGIKRSIIKMRGEVVLEIKNEIDGNGNTKNINVYKYRDKYLVSLRTISDDFEDTMISYRIFDDMEKMVDTYRHLINFPIAYCTDDELRQEIASRKLVREI